MKAGRPSRLVGLATAAYRGILALWTPDLRRRYRWDAVQLFRARVEAARGHGRIRAVVVAVRGLTDALREVARGAPRGRSTDRSRPFHGHAWGEAMTTMTRDVRHAVRRLRRRPRFSLVMILTFAIAVGVTAAAHAAVYRLVLAPLPFPASERLVFVGEADGGGEPGVTSRYVLDLLDRTSTSLEGLATFNIAGATLTGSGDPTTLHGAVVSPDYFDVLGTQPVLGRGFRAEDGGEGAPARVIVSHAVWRDRLGSDAAAVGRPVVLDGTPYEVVGVLPPDFESPDEYVFTNHIRGRPSFWIPYRSDVPRTLGRSHRGVGRLAPGASLDRLRAEATALPGRIEEEGLTWPDGHRVVVRGLQEQITADVRPALRLLVLAVVFALLAGCVNAMGLSLARGLERMPEIGVKAALGAGRGRLLRDVVLESVILGLAGGVLGLAVGAMSLELLQGVAPADIPRLGTVRLGTPTVAVVLGVALTASLAAGLVPALRLPRQRYTPGRGSRGRGATAGRVHRRALDLFAAAQIALALVLLTGSALLVRSFSKLSRVDLGFEPRGLTIGVASLPAPDPGERRALEDALLRRLEADPAVASAALATTAPQHGLNDFQVSVRVEGYAGEDAPVSFYRRVSDGFAEAMGMRLRQGRFLRLEDVEDGEEGLTGPAVVNEAFVRRYLQGREPLGAELDFGGWGFASTRIVGVVEDARFGWPGAPSQAALYLPLLGEFSTVFVLARGDGGTAPDAGSIRRALAEVAPGVPVDEVFLSEGLVRATTAKTEVTMLLLVGLALFTTGLTCVGLYGIVAHTVATRRREMAIRMASGATGRRVVGLVVAQGMRPIVAGLVMGGAGALATAGLTEAVLFGVERGDPVSHLAAALLLTVVGATACYLPARRIGRLDPGETLRTE